MRLPYLTLSLAVSKLANGLSISNTTVLQQPSSGSANVSAFPQIPAESLCDYPHVRPISTLAPDSYLCFVTGASRLLYVEADFLDYQRPPQYSARDRSDLLSLLNEVYSLLDSYAGSTGNPFLPAPMPPHRFSDLTFTKGGMNLVTSTFPCDGTISPFHGFSRIARARYGDISILIARMKALMQNRVSGEKNVATIRIFGFGRRQPYKLQYSEMLGMMAWRSTQIADFLPEEMQTYRRYTCTEAANQTGDAVAVD